ncbi:hypothetical protein [Streptomyces cyaneofuscatus]|uniref:hypothetical protein n=1 Tax=Streptomyces cyaneofuscatus TaxID=66883 RepID=UPI00363D9015
MTTTPRGHTMPNDPNHRALLKAVGSLTTQVRRIADTLETPVDTTDDGAQTTRDDTRRCVCGDPLQWYTAPGGASGWVHEPTPGKPVLDVHTPRPADAPAWTLCTCGDKPVTAQHPEPCPLSREPHVSRLAEMHGVDAAEWKKTAAVYSGLHSTAEDEVRDLTAKLEEATAAIERVREVHAWLTRNYPGFTEPASRLFLALSPNGKEG